MSGVIEATAKIANALERIADSLDDYMEVHLAEVELKTEGLPPSRVAKDVKTRRAEREKRRQLE